MNLDSRYVSIFTTPNGIRWKVRFDSPFNKLVRQVVITHVHEGRTAWQGKRGTAKN